MLTAKSTEIRLTTDAPATGARLDPVRTGLAVGLFAAFIHLGWALAVATSLAQPLIDLVFRLHFLHPVYTAGVFDIPTGIALIVASFVWTASLGFVFAKIWNGFTTRH